MREGEGDGLLAGEVTVHSLRKGKGHGHLVEMWERYYGSLYILDEDESILALYT